MGDGLKRAFAAARATQVKPGAEPKLAEIAARIAAHLARFEADPAIRETQNISGPRVRLYLNTEARKAGSSLYVKYAPCKDDNITKAQALGYLAWLDAGNVGRHWEWERAAAKAAPLTDADMLARERARIMKERAR